MMTDTPSAALQHRIGVDGLLVVRLEEGDIDLIGIDGEAVTVRPDGRDSADGLTLERGDRSLAISAGRGSTPDDLAIELPTGATVVVESRSGDIAAARLSGDVRITTGSGDVTIRDTAGTLAVEAVSGDVRIESSTELDAVARTVSGDLGVRVALLRSAQLATTSGDLAIAAAFADDGTFRIETVSGDTTIEALSRVRVEATTLTGDIHGPSAGGRDDHPRGTVVVGSTSGPTVAFRSTSGDLSLRVAEASAPSSLAAAEPAPPLEPEADPELDVLRALERGEIDVDEAGHRLNALDHEGVRDA